MALALRSMMLARTVPSHFGFMGILNSKSCRSVTLKVRKPQQEPVEDYDHRNMRIGRPQSPHLSIYAPQLTSMLSIVHRVSGSVLGGYMIIVGVGYLALPHDINHYVTMIEGLELPSYVILAGKFIFGFPLCYHWCNGVRHLLWDACKFLSLKEIFSTGYVMVAAVIIMTSYILCH